MMLLMTHTKVLIKVCSYTLKSYMIQLCVCKLTMRLIIKGEKYFCEIMFKHLLEECVIYFHQNTVSNDISAVEV
jgi:hypothetical protein